MYRLNIEDQARRVQQEIWSQRHIFFPSENPLPIQVLHPEYAAFILGYRYEAIPRIRAWRSGPEQFETAGVIDRQQKLIVVSGAFDESAIKFTGAHEVGHIVLHKELVMHRDRPLVRLESYSRNAQDAEADYFAACFLAPEKLVVAAYRDRFHFGPPMPLNNETAMLLLGTTEHAVMRAGPSEMQLALAVATCQRFAGKRFSSMAELFGISASAMAIRLVELELVPA